MYAAAAIESGAPIGALASVAGSFHDTESVAAFYGGATGVAARLERAQRAHERFLATGELAMVPAYDAGNELAGMFIPMDYYTNPATGQDREWRNEMSELTWLYWLTFDGLSAAERLDVPALFVHGDECVFPHHVRRIHERIRTEAHQLASRLSGGFLRPPGSRAHGRAGGARALRRVSVRMRSGL